MSQQSCYKAMYDEPDKWWTTRELSEHLDICRSAVCCNVLKLFKNGFIVRKYCWHNRTYYKYKINKRFI